MSKLFYTQIATFFFENSDSPLRNLENRMRQDLTIGAFGNLSLEGGRPFPCTLSRNLDDMKIF